MINFFWPYSLWLYLLIVIHVMCYSHVLLYFVKDKILYQASHESKDLEFEIQFVLEKIKPRYK